MSVPVSRVLPLLLLILLLPSRVSAADCDGNVYSFVSFSDDYMMGLSSGLANALDQAAALDPNLRMVIANGDETDVQVARETVDGVLSSRRPCGEPEFPFFTAMGNHNLDGDDTSLSWYASTYANNWTTDPAQSRMALQLPGLTNFKRGPLQVRTSAGTASVVDGSIYSFDFKNAHFAFINNYEQDVALGDAAAGAWDVNGAGVHSPQDSQLDWLKDDLTATTKPVKFVFSHVGLVAPGDPYPMSGLPGCGEWSEHSGPFHTADLAKVLADANVTAVYRGHDHCPSRALVDGNNSKVFERSFLDAFNDSAGRPYGNTSLWTGLLGPGRVWQVDDGSVYNNMGAIVLTKVSDSSITFETWRFSSSGGALSLWDAFTIPVAGGPAPPASPTGVVVR